MVRDILKPRLEIDGQRATVERLIPVTVTAYGHFTAMQVREHRVRGLALHLARLDTANSEMFGEGLAGERVRDLIRQALGDDTPDASVRVHVHRLDAGSPPSVIVIVRPPAGVPGTAQRLQSAPYQRSLAHLKHVGDFGQSYYRDLAQRSGFDDALLTTPGGVISEGSLTNVGFFDGTTVVWPAAPMLTGTSMTLIEAGLAGVGLASRRELITLNGLGSYTSAFVTNSRGIAPVGQVDEHPFGVDGQFMSALTDAYESAPWDRI